MIRINLLPHRQIKRAERQRQFILMLAVITVLGGAVVFAGQTLIDSRVNAQTERNARLETANAQLEKEIEEIKTLKGQIQDVLSRKQVVENLQTNRSQAVVVLDEISRKLPEGMYLKSIKQKANLITTEGVADTNARVATLVRNLSSSEWMENPGLVEIKSSTVNGLKQNEFTLNVQLKAQQPPESDSDHKKIGGNKP
ncbi:MAG: PilN domain-containing protein [Methylophilaceae bacterium]